MNARIIRTGDRRFFGPWVHWCLYDRDCRASGCPRDIYIHPLGIVIRFGEGK